MSKRFQISLDGVDFDEENLRFWKVDCIEGDTPHHWKSFTKDQLKQLITRLTDVYEEIEQIEDEENKPAFDSVVEEISRYIHDNSGGEVKVTNVTYGDKEHSESWKMRSVDITLGGKEIQWCSNLDDLEEEVVNKYLERLQGLSSRVVCIELLGE